MFSRFFQPYGLKRRLDVEERQTLDPARQLRYVDLVDQLRAGTAGRLELLAEKAEIDALAGRPDVALAGLDLAAALADAPERRRLDLQRARTLHRAGRLDDAEEVLQAIVVEADDDDLAPSAFLLLGRVHLEQGRFGLATQVLRAGLDAPVPPWARLLGLYDLVYALVREASYDEAEAVLGEAEAALTSGDSLSAARVAYYRAWVAFARRRIGEATSLLDEARREFAHHRDIDALACVDLSLACLDLERADLAVCLQRCDTALDKFPEARVEVTCSLLLLRSLTLFIMGRFPEALAELRRTERLGTAHGLAAIAWRALQGRAEVHRFRGEADLAEAELATCLQQRQAAGDRLGEAMVLSDLGNVLRQQGQSRAALDRYAEARVLAEAIGNRWELARIDSEEMEAWLQRGDTARAERKAQDAARGYEALGDRVRLSRIVKHQAQIAALRDDFVAAEALFAQALALVDGDPNRILRAEILDSRAEARADAGQIEAALADLDAAQVLSATTGSGHLCDHLAAHASQVRERQAAQAVLNRYMEPKIVSRLLSRGPRRLVENVVQEATILFSDIRGFTNMTERHGPQEVVELLNEHFEAMTEEIVAHGGTIDKFIGDAIMAVFGDPGRPQPDDPHRCVAAAIAMVRRRAQMNAERRQAGLERVEIGVGIATGSVVMGNIGSVRRMSYTVIGDAVNVASRLEGLTKTYGEPVLISGVVRARLGDDVEARALGAVEVKGRAGRVDVFAVDVGLETVGLATVLA